MSFHIKGTCAMCGCTLYPDEDSLAVETLVIKCMFPIGSGNEAISFLTGNRENIFYFLRTEVKMLPVLGTYIFRLLGGFEIVVTLKIKEWAKKRKRGDYTD